MNQYTETVPTDLLDSLGATEENDAEDSPKKTACWGRMLPLGSSFMAIDLIKDEYTFGRGEGCDYQFNTEEMIKNSCFQAYSKVHFKIFMEYKSGTGAHAFLHDLSVNGTFVNGGKVGKGRKSVLNNNDEISLAMPKNKAFVYMDVNASTDVVLPTDMKENYTLSKVLGRGACGEVRLAFTKESCKKVAVKIIQKNKFGNGCMTSSRPVMNEVVILRSLQHPCIIAIEEVFDIPDTLFIVMELVEGGELFDRVARAGHLSESITKLLFYQMVCGVKYLHDKDISHRDLKPENILLSSEVEETLVKVTDFGLSKFISSNTMLKTFCGTPNYLAPEVLETAGMGSYTKAIDCWSLGVILFICLSGYPPFSDDRSDKPMNEQILKGDYHHYLKEVFWETISENAKDLLKRFLCIDPMSRATLKEAFEHPWFKDKEMKRKANELMFPSSVTESNPNKRKLDQLD